MVSEIAKFLIGYCILHIEGIGTERFLNIAVKKKIKIWDSCSNGGGIDIKISIASLKKTDEILKKTGCSAQIKKKCGISVYLSEHKLKLFFAGGLLFFIAAMYILSSFLWLIDVSGNERINTNQILKFCEEKGLKTGALKSSVNLRETEALIKDNFPDISWVRISVKGTCAKIKIAENIPALTPRNNEPCDIVASDDGIIVSIAASSGTPMVKSGDVVKKGDVLISSSVTVKENESIVLEKNVHAEGDILAKQWYNIKEEVAFIYYKKIYTGNKINHYTFNVFNTDFSADYLNKKVGFERYDTKSSDIQLKAGEDFALPLALKKTEFWEYKLKKYSRTENDAKKLAENIISKKAEDIFGADKIKDKKIFYTITNDKIIAKALITVIDDIAETVYKTAEETKDAAAQ